MKSTNQNEQVTFYVHYFKMMFNIYLEKDKGKNQIFI